MPCGGPGIDIGHAGAGLVEAGENVGSAPGLGHAGAGPGPAATGTMPAWSPWSRQGGADTWLRASPSAWRCFPVQPPARGRRESTTCPGRSARSPGNPRARHLTREHVT